jgi:hypothetical protein
MERIWVPKGGGTFTLEDDDFYGAIYRKGKHWEYSVSSKKCERPSRGGSARSEGAALQDANMALDRMEREIRYGPKPVCTEHS